MTQANDDVRDAVRNAYGARASEVLAGTPGERARGAAAQLYGEAETLPETVVSYGCGNPVAIAGLREGETVLDLGSGAGLDCFISARQVGPAGRVIGVDMTDEMLALAEQNRAKVGAENVEFRKGLIEDIPIDDSAVDVIISNCVINLSTDKPAVFGEAFRVLRPGGRLQVSDVVLVREISEAERQNLELWAGCQSGALHRDDYMTQLHEAGFEDIEIVVIGGDAADGPAWRSALINARRPGGADSGKPWVLPVGRDIEWLPMVGLEGDACCGPAASIGG